MEGAPVPLAHSDAPPAFSAPTKLHGAAGPDPGPRPEAGGGVGAPVARAIELVSRTVETLDPDRLTGLDAVELYRRFVDLDRLSMAAKTLLAPRIDDSGAWRDGGHRSPAVMLAEIEGVPVGQARNTLDVGRRLPELPETEEALRSGTLSGPKVTELSSAAMLDPEHEGRLLAGAADQPLQKVKERCQRARSTSARQDPLAAVRRIHAQRHFASWFDAEGAFCFKGRDTADRGAKILQQMNHTVVQLRKSERAARSKAGGSESGASEAGASQSGASEAGASQSGTSEETAKPESDHALRADAFFLLLTGRSPVADGSAVVDDDDPGPPDEHISRQPDTGLGVPDRPVTSSRATPGSETGLPPPAGPERDVIDRPPTCSLMVRVDLDALLRGEVEPGEVCEIDNQGPIPVATARDLASDSYLRVLFHRAGDIRAVSHLGRTINRRLRTALAHRDRCCVVPGCGVPYGLEIDHVVPFAEGGPTELDNLALLCHHHHYLKTYEGWTLERTGIGDDGSPTWAFLPLPEFGQEPGPDG